MFRSPPSTSGRLPARRTRLRLFALASSLVLVSLLDVGAALAQTRTVAEEPAARFELSSLASLVTLPSLRAEGPDHWRERGLAFVDLPLGIRARFDASYSRHLYSSDVLAQSFVADFGPEIVGDRTLESRISLTRALAPGVELEIAWETRNSLAVDDPMGFGRQTIGARIRISP